MKKKAAVIKRLHMWRYFEFVKYNILSGQITHNVFSSQVTKPASEYEEKLITASYTRNDLHLNHKEHLHGPTRLYVEHFCVHTMTQVGGLREEKLCMFNKVHDTVILVPITSWRYNIVTP